ncbi:MAG: PQQ-like beta-propeller repeat protein [Gemmatimonadota bacterium]|nr:PQQ-like beta-propeller repeat protein [Gemmatimonadota bacterium]
MTFPDFTPASLRAPAKLLLPLCLLVLGAACSDPLGSGGGALEVLWRTPLEKTFQRSGENPTTDGERLYTVAGGMVTFDARTGAMLWKSPVSMYLPINVVKYGDRVFAAEEVAFAWDAASGRELWRFTPVSDAALGESTVDAHAFYFGTSSYTSGGQHKGKVMIYALDRQNGSPLWSTDVGAGWPYPGLTDGITVSGDTVYAAGQQFSAANGYISTGWIVALDRATGRELWRYRNGTGTDRRTISSAPTVAGRLLLPSDHMGSAFFAVDRFTGKEVWRVTGPLQYFGPNQAPVVIGDVAYVASNDTYVYAVDVATGAIRWKTRTGFANSAFAVCRNQIFVNYAGLAVIDRHSGKLLYKKFDEEDFLTSGFAVHEDRVFVLGNRAAYAYRCS